MLSVVVPIYRQWESVPALVTALADQTLSDAAFEIVLVDNEPDGRHTIPSCIQRENIVVCPCEAPGSYAARNAGVRVAQGAWLVFTDADCLPAPGWLEAMLAAFEGGERLVAGPIVVRASDSSPTPSEIFDTVRGIPQERYVRRGYAATANLGVSRAAFDAVGGFDAARFSGGDAEFCRRLRGEGIVPAYAPAAQVEHPARRSWAQLVLKTRRVRGGQLAPGTPWRYRSSMRVFAGLPINAWRLARANGHSARYRLIAIGMLCALWPIELAEAWRLRRGGAAERR
ncbi:glycosyltransferase [Pararhizobium mangrovi]|uniref:Glycosyltransferase n=2 Tax=Pararhizobium mangrovi TaxID=2590452 RepID=A0A506U6T0_9HYPH|nr:glycosyltransferase [Pararhizobium mangrovi]